MKILRRILTGLALLIVLAALLAAAVFIPAVQTWYVQSRLDARQDVRGTVGSLSAGLHQVELTDLHLELGAVVIDVPSLQASLPVTDAAWKHDVRIRSLVAKGWTIDLSRTLEPDKTPVPVSPVAEPGKSAGSPALSATATAGSADAGEVQQALKILRRIVGGRELPCDLSLDGVELEGDVIVSSLQSGSVRVHVSIKGGGIGAGREGELAVAADAASPWPGVRAATLQGRVLVAAKSPRRLDRVEFKSDLALAREAPAGDLNLALELGLARGDGEAIYRASLSQGGRRLVACVAHCPEAARRLSGEWQAEVTKADVALLAPDGSYPEFTATAAGRFETDASFARMNVTGKLDARAAQLGVIAPGLARLGAVAFSAQFNLERAGGVLHFAELGATMTQGNTALSLQSRQAFAVDEQTGALTVADAKGDWLEGSVRDLPLDWISDRNDPVAITGESLSGGFVVRSTGGGWALRPKQVWTVGGVTVQRAGRPLVRDLHLALAWLADYDSTGWRWQWAPLTVSRSGRKLATVAAKFVRPPGADRSIGLNGTWSAEVEAIAALPEFSSAGRISARTASGDFTGSLAALSQVEVNLTVVGHDPAHVFTANLTAGEESEGKWSFQIPCKMSVGPQVTDLSAEGSWISGPGRGRSYVRVTGEKLTVEQLGRCAAPLAVLAGVTWPANLWAGARGGPAAPGRDRAPFWGDAEGTLVFDIGQVYVGDRSYRNVGGSLEFGARELRLDQVRGQRVETGPDAGLRGRGDPAQLAGRISFDPAAERPYTLKATADLGEIDVASLLPPGKPGEDPLLEGHFTVTGGLSGRGGNLAELAAGTQQEFKLTSKGGISRLLKTYIGDAFQDEETSAISDTVGGVGSLVGKLLAIKSEPREKKVSKAVENVLDLSSQLAEVEFESGNLSLVRGADGSIRIAALELIAPDQRLTGTGRIAVAPGADYRTQPLTLELMLGARGRAGELLGKAGLLSARKDRLGYVNLNQTLHFGGSLEHLDQTAWHDLLIKAMKRKPDGK